MTNYLEVKNLSKSFDSFQLHNISFTLPKGYIMGLIGPNGSGKTTTIKLILNMLKRNGGEIKIMGAVCRDAAEVPHRSHQESERTLKGYADEVDAGLCVLLRRKAADPGRTHQRPRSGFQR